MGSGFNKLPNGKYLTYLRMVKDDKTGRDDAGDPCRLAVYRVLTGRIAEMLKQLGHKPGDVKLNYPGPKN